VHKICILNTWPWCTPLQTQFRSCWAFPSWDTNPAQSSALWASPFSPGALLHRSGSPLPNSGLSSDHREAWEKRLSGCCSSSALHYQGLHGWGDRGCCLWFCSSITNCALSCWVQENESRTASSQQAFTLRWILAYMPKMKFSKQFYQPAAKYRLLEFFGLACAQIAPSFPIQKLNFSFGV